VRPKQKFVFVVRSAIRQGRRIQPKLGWVGGLLGLGAERPAGEDNEDNEETERLPDKGNRAATFGIAGFSAGPCIRLRYPATTRPRCHVPLMVNVPRVV